MNVFNELRNNRRATSQYFNRKIIIIKDGAYYLKIFFPRCVIVQEM